MSIIAKDGFKLIQESGTVFCDSRELAKQFDKDHPKVLKDIEREIERFDKRDMDYHNYFILADYHSGKRTYKRYKLTFKGFQMIALQFTGDKAFDNRLKFINFFEYLLKNIEKDKLTALKNSEDREWLEFRNDGKEVHTAMTDAIKKHVVDYRLEVEGKINDGRYYQHYAKLVNKILGVELPKGAETRNTFDKKTLIKAEILEEKIASLIEKYANDGMEYGEVYKKIKEELL